MAASDNQGSDPDRPRRSMGTRDRGEREGSAGDENSKPQIGRRATVWRGRDENLKRDPAAPRPERAGPPEGQDRPEQSGPPSRSVSPSRDFSERNRSLGERPRENGGERPRNPSPSRDFSERERPPARDTSAERPPAREPGDRTSRDFSLERGRDFSERPRDFSDRRGESRSWQDRDRMGRPEGRREGENREMPRREPQRSTPFPEERSAPRRDFSGGGASSGGGFRGGGGREGGFRGDDFPRREREPYARDERRPARYSSAAGSRYGVGRGGPRIPRPPLKKKKKVRVFFHQALTRILLPKLLTKSKYLSPRLARIFIETGRVRVNARVVSSPYYEVNLRKERVTIDEAPTEYPRRLAYMIYNKPHGMVAEKGDAGFDEIFEPECTWSFPFGRLSKAASGLVILSSDPRMIKRQHVVDIELQKEYRVKLNKHLSDEQLDEFRRGVLVGDDYLVPLRVNLVRRNANSMWLDIILLDDSYHRIYGALKALGTEVLLLRRSRIGLINDAMVPSGEWRELSGFEIAALGLAKFMPGELPPEPLPPPRPKMERKFPPKRGDMRDDRRGGGGPKGAWERRPGPGGGSGGGKRPYSPARPSREEDYEDRLRQEAEADAIGNK